jgi:hypothetical protein
MCLMKKGRENALLRDTKMKKIPGASKHSGIFFFTRRSLGEGGWPIVALAKAGGRS